MLIDMGCYGLHNGQKFYVRLKFDENEVKVLLSGMSVVKHGRHWWII